MAALRRALVVIGKDTSFLYFGAEAEARFNVALTVVVAPPSSTGPLGMLQTASARLYGRLAMGNLTQPAADAATLLLRPGSDLEDLGDFASVPLRDIARSLTRAVSCQASAWMKPGA